MTTELPKQYDPRDAQQRWSKFWDERQFFHARPDAAKEPFAIVIPPPNVTGALHMGHALNNTLQDVLIRWRRMQGYNAMWMPGTDHAGIATQAVVERLVMQTEKKTRHDLGRDELVKRIWQWKDKYEARILGQLRSMGCSCDWQRTRFTLDETCARAVRQTFFNLFRDGLIYRGKRLVNWDTQLQTSVADDETYTEDIKGSFWTFKYPVVGEPDTFIRFSTTRPETMLGDTAVCVHPSDERYKHLIGKKVTIPLVGREIPIIADALLADPKLGTGCVKVTPAHDPNDYACWSRNPHIGMINILNPDGTINENGGKYQGLDRYKAREAVVAEMESLGFFEGKEDREIPMKYSDRSKSPIEPLLSDQWFVKMGDLASLAQRESGSPLPPGEGLGVRAERTHPKEAKPRHAALPPNLLEFARQLREQQTDAEQLLWFLLRDRRVHNAKFRRQHPVEPYVLDFYCHEAQLAVELDGGQHNTPEGKARDENRSVFLAKQGIHVLRFWNHDILKDTEVVLEAIWNELETRLPASEKTESPQDATSLPSPPAPLPGGEGSKTGLAQRAMQAVEDGRVKFTPERYKNSYLDWLAEKRDWCISRQLWWGHQIPVWSLRLNQDHFNRFPAKAFGKNITEQGIIRAELSKVFAEEGIQEFEEEAFLDPTSGTDEIRFCVKSEKGDAIMRSIEREIERRKKKKDVYSRFGLISEYLDSVERDADVLDTWFSSALWPHSTLGWPEQTPELKYWYPTSVLCTSRDIITLWVARMVLTGLYNVGEIPFHNVYIHPKLLDGFGETMSKSKGNGIDPLDIIDRYGVDAMRFVMAHLATETQDNRMPVANVCPHCDTLIPVKQEHMYMRTKKLACPSCKKPFRPGGPWPTDDPDLPTAKQASDRFDMGRNFANKIWNAARFILMNLDGYEPKSVTLGSSLRRNSEVSAAIKAAKEGTIPESSPAIEDLWILSRLATTTATITRELEAFRFAESARLLYEFVWTEFCDWYVEMAKGRLKTDGKPIVQRMLVGLLDAIVRLAQPMMPFLSESIWQTLNEVAFERGLPSPEPSAESVTIAPWPSFPAEWQDASMETRFARMQELVRAIREVRNRYNVEPKTNLDVFVRAPQATADDFATLAPFIRQLAGVGTFEVGADVAKPQQSASHVSPDFEAYVSLKGLIDVAVEIKRLEKQLAEKRKHLQTTQAKLDNPAFAEKAPKELVAQQRDALADTQKQIASIEATIQELSAAT